MDERELIELITREVIGRLTAAGMLLPQAKPSKAPLVILSGRFQESQTLVHFIDRLVNTPGEFRIFLDGLTLADLPEGLHSRIVKVGELLTPTVSSGSAVSLIGNGCLPVSTEAQLDALIQQTSNIVLPWFPLPVLSRLVHLQPECPVSLLLTKALLAKVPVKARKVLTQPEIDLYQSIELSPILRRVQSLVSEGKLLGIEWLAKAETVVFLQALVPPKPKARIKPGQKMLLTAADVKQMKAQGEIVVPKGTIVTPLAKDEMKKYGLRFRID